MTTIVAALHTDPKNLDASSVVVLAFSALALLGGEHLLGLDNAAPIGSATAGPKSTAQRPATRPPGATPGR